MAINMPINSTIKIILTNFTFFLSLSILANDAKNSNMQRTYIATEPLQFPASCISVYIIITSIHNMQIIIDIYFLLLFNSFFSLLSIISPYDRILA